MITIHHLGVSQSDRIVWLMEELELPFELKWYDRGPDSLAPLELREVHPAGIAPIITAGIGGREIDDSLPNTLAYIQRVTARPAYQKAMAIAGPDATRPEA